MSRFKSVGLKQAKFNTYSFIVFAISFAAIGGYFIFKSFAATTTANLWVDTTGGTCTRQATPGAYSDTAACGSFDAAYQAASAGDTILIKGGTYGEQNIQNRTTIGTTPVLMQVSPNETVTINEAFSIHTHDLIVEGGGTVGVNETDRILVNGDTGCPSCRGWALNFGTGNDSPQVNGVIAEDIHTRNVYFDDSAHDDTLRYSNVGPSDFGGHGNLCSDLVSSGETTNITVEYNDVHDNKDTGCGAAHIDAFDVFFHNGIVRGNHIWWCGTQCVFTGDPGSMLVENNMIEETNACGDGCADPGEIALMGTVTVRYNTFEGTDGYGVEGSRPGNAQVYANIFLNGSVSCDDLTGDVQVHYDRNIFTSGSPTCGNAKVCTPRLADGNLYTNTDRQANYHLAANDTCAKDAGAGATATTKDIDEQARPQGTAIDIGADEVASTATYPNVSGANIFVSSAAPSDDSGVNCKRYATAQAAPPTASTVCGTFPAAYNLAQLGDTVWVLAGTYNGARQNFTSSNPVTGKSLASTDCRVTNQCIYFIPQPGQESAIHLYQNVDGGFDISDDPDHSYFKNFGSGACPSVGPGGDDVTDITFDNVKGTIGGDSLSGCKIGIIGHQSYVRIINSEFSYNCNTGTASGSFIGATTGESSTVSDTPDHVLLDHDYFHDFVINQGGGSCGPADPHQDCIHIYAWLNSTLSNSKFSNCYDSSVLAEGFDLAGYAENDIIENNWFGPTILGVNNCCMRGDSDPAAETFDNWIIRFNSSTSAFMNKTGNVLNNVSFIGNIGLGDNVCRSGTNLVWKYNIYTAPSGKCDPTDTAGVTNTTVKFVNMSISSLDLHIQSGSIADGYVPVTQANGCSSVSGSKDRDGDARATTGACDAGADEFTTGGGSAKPGDVNSDGFVNITDLSILLSNWGTTNATCDLNTNGSVDVFDLSILLSNYGS